MHLRNINIKCQVQMGFDTNMRYHLLNKIYFTGQENNRYYYFIFETMLLF